MTVQIPVDFRQLPGIWAPEIHRVPHSVYLLYILLASPFAVHVVECLTTQEEIRMVGHKGIRA